MRSAHIPMNSLGTLGRPGESLVPGVGEHGMRAGDNVPGDFSPDSQCARSRVRVLGFPAHIKHLPAHGGGGLLTNRSSHTSWTRSRLAVRPPRLSRLCFATVLPGFIEIAKYGIGG
jgi:hypothetical protein